MQPRGHPLTHCSCCGRIIVKHRIPRKGALLKIADARLGWCADCVDAAGEDLGLPEPAKPPPEPSYAERIARALKGRIRVK